MTHYKSTILCSNSTRYLRNSLRAPFPIAVATTFNLQLRSSPSPTPLSAITDFPDGRDFWDYAGSCQFLIYVLGYRVNSRHNRAGFVWGVYPDLTPLPSTRFLAWVVGHLWQRARCLQRARWLPRASHARNLVHSLLQACSCSSNLAMPSRSEVLNLSPASSISWPNSGRSFRGPLLGLGPPV